MEGTTIKMLQHANENFYRAASRCVMGMWPSQQQFWLEILVVLVVLQQVKQPEKALA